MGGYPKGLYPHTVILAQLWRNENLKSESSHRPDPHPQQNMLAPPLTANSTIHTNYQRGNPKMSIMVLPKKQYSKKKKKKDSSEVKLTTDGRGRHPANNMEKDPI